jgi:cell division protein FtsN
MTRDYVRSSRPTTKRKTANKPVSRGKPSNSTAPFPMMRAILALVLVIGFGIFLYHISGSSGDTPAVAANTAPTVAPIPIEKQRPAKEQFDYMQILQNKEVPVELPDGQVIGDPSKDPQILQQQQKMQDMLKSQQERAKILAQQQNGQLPADADDDSDAPPAATTLTSPATKTANISKPISQPATTVAPTNQTQVAPTQHADARKPHSFAEVIANESNKTSKPASTTTATTATAEHKTVTQERDEALAMFGKPRPYAADTATTAKTTTARTPAATSPTTAASNKRFMMQCGAFRTADQASTLRSRIAVQGQTAQVNQGNNASGTWHRVVLGPYANRPAAEQVLSRLKAAGTIQSCTIYSQ